jgi:hypothetical protein
MQIIFFIPQNYCFFVLCQSPGIIKLEKAMFSKQSGSILGGGGGAPLLGPL